METLTGSAAAQLLAGKPLCSRCAGLGVNGRRTGAGAMSNALVVDAAGLVHAGDAIEGRTSCGLNGNAWQWVIPVARPQLDEARRP